MTLITHTVNLSTSTFNSQPLPLGHTYGLQAPPSLVSLTEWKNFPWNPRAPISGDAFFRTRTKRVFVKEVWPGRYLADQTDVLTFKEVGGAPSILSCVRGLIRVVWGDSETTPPHNQIILTCPGIHLSFLACLFVSWEIIIITTVARLALYDSLSKNYFIWYPRFLLLLDFSERTYDNHKDTKYLDLLLAHFRKNNSSLNQPLPYYYLIINIA